MSSSMSPKIELINEGENRKYPTYCLLFSMIFDFNVLSYIYSHINFWYLPE